jgi:hypothetical protein
MDSLFSHKLESGRTIYLDAFHIAPTPFGVLGSTAPLEQSVVEHVSRLYPGSKPQIIGLQSGLPFICVGSFRSAIIEDQDSTCSLLLLCWFTSNPNSSLSQFVQSGLSGIDWDAHAEDVLI